MKVNPTINELESRATTFNGKVGKSVYKYYKAQRQNILNQKNISRLDIEVFKEVGPQTLQRLREFMNKLHPDTTLEFATKENSNSVVPYFYNSKTDTKLEVPAPSNHRPVKKTIFTGALNLVMGKFSPIFIRENIKTIDLFSTDLVSLTSKEGNSPKDIDDELFRKMFNNMASEIIPNNFLSDFILKRNARKLDKLAVEFDVVDKNYSKQLYYSKAHKEKCYQKELAKKLEEQKIKEEFKIFEIK